MDVETLENDEVICETDVYLSNALKDNLYIFHYPIQMRDSTSEQECLSARVKPNQQKVELEFAINVESNNFDESRAQNIAINADGNNPNEGIYDSGMMDKFTLQGSKACLRPENYAVCFLRDGELHMNPVHSIVELRPSFSHMDIIEAKARKDQALDEGNAEEEEAVSVTVRFEGPNAEKDRQKREKSYKFLQQKNASEPWAKLNYHKMGSSQSKRELDNLVCGFMGRDVSKQGMDFPEYMKDLLPQNLKQSGYRVAEDGSAMLSRKPLGDQMKHLLVNAHVMPFALLRKKVSVRADAETMARLVQQIALLVRGNWVVKSELLYPENSVSPLTGVSSKLLVNARDYLLWLFSKSEVVKHKEVSSVIYIPYQDFESMIKLLAVKTSAGWKFRYECDTDFLENNSAIEGSQEIKWTHRYKKLVKDLSIGMSDVEGEFPRHKPRQKRNSSSEDQVPFSGDQSPDKRRRHTSVRSRQLASTKSRPSDPGSAHRPSDPPIAGDALVYLREIVGEAMRLHTVMTLSEVRRTLVEAETVRGVLDRPDFEGLVEGAMAACGARKIENKWPQNTAPEPLYACIKMGNKLDKYRKILLGLFCVTARMRPNLFHKQIEDELREVLSDSDCKQIFDEYCVYKSGYFYLKGTIVLDS